MANFTESVVEDAALAWLESLGYAIKHGPEIAPGELFAERKDYGQVVLSDRLRQALVRLNPALPAEALDDAFRKITRLEGATLDGRNRAFHRLLVDGIAVEVRQPSPQPSPIGRGVNSGDSIQQLTSSMRQMQNLPPWQGSPEWSFQISRITLCNVGEKKGSPIRRLLSRASAPLTRRSNCFRLCYAKSEHI